MMRRPWRRRLNEAGEGFSELEGQLEITLFAAGGDLHQKTSLVEGVENSDEVKQELDRNADAADVPVMVEGPLAEESEHEVEAVGEEGGVVEGEAEGGVAPFRTCPAAVVDGGGVPSVGVDERVAED